MKEHGDGESNTATRPPPVGHIPTDKLLQDRGHLQHLVSSSIPSPPFPGLTLFSPSALFGTDPRAMLSAHLLASIQMASNPDARFQIPISLPLTVQTTPSQHYHSAGTGYGQVTGLPPSTHPTAQLNIFSSWVKEHSQNEDMKILSGNKTGGHKNKRESNWSVSKANKRNKPPAQIQNGLISSDIHISIKKDLVENKGDNTMNGKRDKKKDNESNSGIRSENLPNDKIIKVEQLGDTHQPVNNNNNIIGSIQQQQSNQQSRDKVFICPICSRCFGYKHVLQNHERTHTGEKPFECTICQKKFTRDHHLKTHMRLHTGEKPYQCTHCDRLFVQVANLRRHLRVHTGERPYSCELCQNRFSDSNQLKAHMLVHKGEKPYSCSACNGRFRRRHHLIQHKCINKEASPVGSLPCSPPEDISPPSNGKRERKSRETRRIIRLASRPVSTVTSTSMGFGQIIPEQTHPEDLSVSNGNGIRGRHFSGSHSSCSASPSPPSGGSHGSIGIYCRSITSSDPPEYSSDEDRSVTASSSNNGKTESDEASPHV